MLTAGKDYFVYFPLSFANKSNFTKHRFCFADAGSCFVGSRKSFARYFVRFHATAAKNNREHGLVKLR
uniref:Uncharacterized protein n=1 Tax=Candidatus Kentrum sp. LFY TaxID=2126342 RepID=A0A450WFU2_9GAMM|nr:MAG: hypothetical protein BECKLFY1418C_GA0070996_10195 [Candidatus Kentron sp. LFY]